MTSAKNATSSALAAVARSSPSPLSKNVKFSEIFITGNYLQPPNYVRHPLWKSWWEAQFNNRTFFLFGKSWMAATSLLIFLCWTRIFDPPPKERLDKYWLNSPKFRILTSYHNPGKRPAYKISCLTFNTRYYHRGIDHPFGINEWKDHLFKLHEQFVIEQNPGVQYPYVHRQFNRVQTPDVLEVHKYPSPARIPSSEYH